MQRTQLKFEEPQNHRAHRGVPTEKRLQTIRVARLRPQVVSFSVLEQVFLVAPQVVQHLHIIYTAQSSVSYCEARYR